MIGPISPAPARSSVLRASSSTVCSARRLAACPSAMTRGGTASKAAGSVPQQANDAATAARAECTAEEAAALAGAPSKQETVFYTHTLCPYAERVWIVLLERGVPHRLVHIDLSHKPSWYRSVNPCGLVPALQHSGRVQLESADICRHMDALAAGPSLTPADFSLQREMEALLRGPWNTARPWGIGGGQTAAQREAFEAQLSGLDASLQRHGGPFLLGSHPSLADVMAYPFMKRFDVAKPLSGYDVGAALGGSIGRWLVAMDARPSCRTTAASSHLLLEAYQEHRSLDFFDCATYSCFQLHPHNACLLRQQ